VKELANLLIPFRRHKDNDQSCDEKQADRWKRYFTRHSSLL
jgi:hypothetical protein